MACMWSGHAVRMPSAALCCWAHGPAWIGPCWCIWRVCMSIATVILAVGACCVRLGCGSCWCLYRGAGMHWLVLSCIAAHQCIAPICKPCCSTALQCCCGHPGCWKGQPTSVSVGAVDPRPSASSRSASRQAVFSPKSLQCHCAPPPPRALSPMDPHAAFRHPAD